MKGWGENRDAGWREEGDKRVLVVAEPNRGVGFSAELDA